MLLDLTLVVEGETLMAHKMLSCNILNCLCLQHEIVHFKQELLETGFMTVGGMQAAMCCCTSDFKVIELYQDPI